MSVQSDFFPFLFCYSYFVSPFSPLFPSFASTYDTVLSLTLLVTARVKEISSLCPRKIFVSCFYALQGDERTLLNCPISRKTLLFLCKVRDYENIHSCGSLSQVAVRETSLLGGLGVSKLEHRSSRMWQTCPVQASSAPVALFQHLR